MYCYQQVKIVFPHENSVVTDEKLHLYLLLHLPLVQSRLGINENHLNEDGCLLKRPTKI